MIIKNILIGEDLRQEIGNKFSLMGIFGGSINLNIPKVVPHETPAAVSLAFLISIANNDPKCSLKDFSAQVTISIEENTFANVKANFESEEVDHIIHLPISRMLIPVQDKCVLKVHAQIFKNGGLISEDSIILKINVDRLSLSAN